MAKLLARLTLTAACIGLGTVSWFAVIRFYDRAPGLPPKILAIHAPDRCPPVNDAKRAFDGSVEPASFWECLVEGPLPLTITYAQATTLRKYEFLAGESKDRMPITWKLFGSNSGAAWIELDQRTNLTDWSVNTSRAFSVQKPGLYSSYRFEFERTLDGRLLRVYEIALAP